MRNRSRWDYGFPGSKKIQALNNILDAAILSVTVCGEDVEVTEIFTYLGGDIHVSDGCEAEVKRRLGRAWESWINWIMGYGTVRSCALG